MRYLHYEPGKIRDYISENCLRVWKCSFDGSSSPIEAQPDLIVEMFGASQTLWGRRLPYYAVASESSDVERVTLEQVVSEVESLKSSGKFVVAAYEDGGLITASGVVLSFQIDARQADWWWPTVRSAWTARLADWKKRINWLT